MKVFTLSFLLISFFLCTCCQNGSTLTYIGAKKNIDTTSSIIGRTVILDHSKLNTSLSGFKYNVLYSFNANCAGCIVELVNVLKKYNSHRGKSYDSTRFYFFAITENPEQLKYHLKENNVEFNVNQFLVFEDLESFYSKNSGIFQQGTINTILTNNKFQVLENTDPFANEKAKESYQSTCILQNIKLNN